MLTTYEWDKFRNTPYLLPMMRAKLTSYYFMTNSTKLMSVYFYWEAHEDERTVLYKIKSLDGTMPNPNPKLTRILTLFSCFMLLFEHHPLIFSLALLLITALKLE